MRTSALVTLLGQLVHALQMERGLSNIYLASGGERGAAQRLRQIDTSAALQQQVRTAFDHLDTGALRVGNGARLFNRIAYVLQGLDALPFLRQRITALAATPETTTSAYARLIAGLLAVVFEAADSASDPVISRLLVALFNFMQGKEFAGQERATGAAAFGAGVQDAARQHQWLHLIDSQERCFKVFADFAHSAPLALWQACASTATMAELERMRRVGCSTPPGEALDTAQSQVWFDCCTRRMDAMQTVEAQMASDLLHLCEAQIAEARSALQAHQALLDTVRPASPPGHADPDPDTVAAFFDTPATTATTSPPHGYGVHLDRSVLELVQDQAQRLQAMRDELDTVRATLNERKLVERAKGLLMAHRQLSEEDAHKLLRQTAMNQNRRLVDVAEAVLSMAPLLPPR